MQTVARRRDLSLASQAPGLHRTTTRMERILNNLTRSGFTLSLLLFAVLSTVASVQNLRGADDVLSNPLSYLSILTKVLLTLDQVRQIFYYALFNLLWTVLLVPSALLVQFFRRRSLLGWTMLVMHVCHLLRTVLYFSVRATATSANPLDQTQVRYLAVFSNRLELVAILFGYVPLGLFHQLFHDCC